MQILKRPRCKAQVGGNVPLFVDGVHIGASCERQPSWKADKEGTVPAVGHEPQPPVFQYSLLKPRGWWLNYLLKDCLGAP